MLWKVLLGEFRISRFFLFWILKEDHGEKGVAKKLMRQASVDDKSVAIEVQENQEQQYVSGEGSLSPENDEGNNNMFTTCTAYLTYLLPLELNLFCVTARNHQNGNFA